jgi:coniferyl-aldehyde dehydrogenase
MAAAAPNLTPVTLELGGKSPTVIADGYPIGTAAARIAAGKFLNAGQTCIAPDYVLTSKAQIAPLIDALTRYVAERYPKLEASPDYSSIVNERQYQRLVGYLDDARARGAKVIELAQGNPAQRVIAPTLVLDAPDEALVMQEEIFGPILPIVASESVEAAVDYVNARPRPLAFYLFDNDRDRIERTLERVVAGGVSVNETVLHFVQCDLPFGGVGPSGMGSYHAHEGFLTFSKAMPVFYQSRFSSMAFMRPPYGKVAEFILKFLTR